MFVCINNREPFCGIYEYCIRCICGVQDFKANQIIFVGETKIEFIQT